MLFCCALALFLLLSGSAFAFNVAPLGGRREGMKLLATRDNNNVVNVLPAGAILAAAILPLPGPAVSALPADSIVLGGQLSKFGKALYPFLNSVKDVSPLVDAFLGLVDTQANLAKVAQKAVDGLLAIPDSSVTKYAGVLKNDVFKGVLKDSCITLGRLGSGLQKFADLASAKSVDSSKMAALKKKFNPVNLAVPVKNGDICLPPLEAASKKLWTAQAKLTLSMPKTEASALVESIKKGGTSYATQPALAKLVPAAEGVFSKNAEALKMVEARKEVEPTIIGAVQAALK